MTCRFSPDAAKREQTPVDNSFIADFLPAAGALELKAYLYGLMQCWMISGGICSPRARSITRGGAPSRL